MFYVVYGVAFSHEENFFKNLSWQSVYSGFQKNNLSLHAPNGVLMGDPYAVCPYAGVNKNRLKPKPDWDRCLGHAITNQVFYA